MALELFHGLFAPIHLINILNLQLFAVVDILIALQSLLYDGVFLQLEIGRLVLEGRVLLGNDRIEIVNFFALRISRVFDVRRVCEVGDLWRRVWFNCVIGSMNVIFELHFVEIRVRRQRRNVIRFLFIWLRVYAHLLLQDVGFLLPKVLLF